MNLDNYLKKNKRTLRQATLCYLVKKNSVLLAMKKRGFGQGKWNGVGGKPKPGETLIDTITRETQEEICVLPQKIKQVALIDFYFVTQPDWCQQVVVYLSSLWQGEPKETEEMSPCWYPLSQLPLDSMWSSDHFWVPKVLSGELIQGTILFDDKQEVIDHQLAAVSCFE